MHCSYNTNGKVERARLTIFVRIKGGDILQRILIIGCSGAGKSTLARQLGDILPLPVIHLDRLYWQPNWTKTDKPLFLKKLTEQLEKPQWIIDGNFDSTLDLRLQYADCVIFLDFATHTCIRRILWRYVTNFGQTRIDMTEGCTEKIDAEFLCWIARYKRDARPHVVQLLSNITVPSIVLQTPAQAARWLKNIEKKASETA